MISVAIFKWAMNPHDERIGSDGQIKWLAERPEAGDDDPLAGAIRLPHGGDWYNCMAADVLALSQLMVVEKL